ncbi:MAG: hypothetical protein QNK85_09420 [Crocinitomicaceae bacterium]
MKHIFTIILFFISGLTFGQLNGNSTPNYYELISIYESLANDHDEIELYQMGYSDYGLPIYLCIINGAQDSLLTFQKAKNSTTILINNAIHPGEPDGVNASLMWINDWVYSGKKTKDFPLIAIIPAYNVGGMMNRSATSRANQDGPEEYGFRGNAQNLDLNRDFIKMDSKNMFTFAKIYHGLDPDLFLDTHVSNGADYQYTMTYIASVRERMSPSLGHLMHDDMVPYLEEKSSKYGFDLIPYVDLKGEVPEFGIQIFNDLPRYAMGYASLMNSISFTLETHMLKPFYQRVKATKVFIDNFIEWGQLKHKEIEIARALARQWESDMSYYPFNFKLTEVHDSIKFKGFEATHPLSQVTGMERLKYDHDQPYEKEIPYYNEFKAMDSVFISDFYIVGGQCSDVIVRLKANRIQFSVFQKDTLIQLEQTKIIDFETASRPYEGHFIHNGVKKEVSLAAVQLKKGDILISSNQKNKRFLVSVLETNSPDSYFNWNFFDSYLQQKEYFSPYVFEDKALQILNKNSELKKRFELKKVNEPSFANSSWDQLFYIYKKSDYYEPTHNVLPVFRGMYETLK